MHDNPDHHPTAHSTVATALVRSQIWVLERALRDKDTDTEEKEDARCEKIYEGEQWLKRNGIVATLNDDTGRYTWRRI